MGIKINKLFNSGWNNVEYGQERTQNSEISVLPLVSDMYEESTTSDMVDLINRKSIEEDMYKVFKESPWYEKYSADDKKVEKKEIPELYFYFKNKMIKEFNYNLVEIICIICEFFNLNYSNMYNNVLSLEDKSKVLEILESDYGLQNKFAHSKKLF